MGCHWFTNLKGCWGMLLIILLFLCFLPRNGSIPAPLNCEYATGESSPSTYGRIGSLHYYIFNHILNLENDLEQVII